jgi:hypothetical protein
MKYQPLTCTIKIKYLHHLYFTKLGNIYVMPQFYTLSLVNCNTKLMQDYSKELITNYTAIVELDLFSVN